VSRRYQTAENDTAVAYDRVYNLDGVCERVCVYLTVTLHVKVIKKLGLNSRKRTRLAIYFYVHPRSTQVPPLLLLIYPFSSFCPVAITSCNLSKSFSLLFV